MCILHEKDASEEGNWRYHGQTEWIEDNQNPAFTSQLEIPSPSPSSTFRFTLIDIDDPKNLPTTFDPNVSSADMLGLADISGADLIKASLSKSQITMALWDSSHSELRQGGPTITIGVETVLDSERSCLIFQSRSAGCHIGRMHAMLFSSVQARNQWDSHLKSAIARAQRDKAMINGVILSWQQAVRSVYDHTFVQSEYLSPCAWVMRTQSRCARHFISALTAMARFGARGEQAHGRAPAPEHNGSTVPLPRDDRPPHWPF
jgi:hypothetical protein